MLFCGIINVLVERGDGMENVEVRVKKGNISCKSLGKKIGVHENTVANWLNRPNLDEVKKQRLLIAIQEIKEGR